MRVMVTQPSRLIVVMAGLDRPGPGHLPSLLLVTPPEAGVQLAGDDESKLDSGLRRNDDEERTPEYRPARASGCRKKSYLFVVCS